MNKKAKEPFFVSHVISLVLGVIVLGMIVAMLLIEQGTEIYETLIFSLAAGINFISAVRCFSQQRMVRGNMYAVICAVFLIVAVFLAVHYFIFV